MTKQQRDSNFNVEDGAAGARKAFWSRPNGGRRLSQQSILMIFSAVLVFALGALYWANMNETFPRLAPGSYLGRIHGIFPQERSTPTLIYVEQAYDSNRLQLMIIRAGWSPTTLDLGEIGDRKTLPALSISAPEARLRLTGSETGTGQYHGEVINLDTSSKGSWSLMPVDQTLLTQNRGESWEREVRLWLALQVELQTVESKIAAAERLVPKQKNEILRLTEYLTEGSALKSKAERKLEQTEQELATAKREYDSELNKARAIAKQLSISQRVTPRGRLVSLARESLERENRWISSMLDSDNVSNDSRYYDELERAKAVSELQGKISGIRENIAQLLRQEGANEQDQGMRTDY